MEKLDSLSNFFDHQTNVAIWYAAYEGHQESILYANPCFAKIFEQSLDQILERKKYRLVNPADTPSEVIATYKQEDQHAMNKGFFLNRSPLDDQQDIVVVKLRFERGILGLFKFVSSQKNSTELCWENLDREMLNILKKCELPENPSL
ncbi:MAG: hypothetical protein L3J39_04865 [Verrucomicrobiales bacterium]|nr:hypothetical protein [Verrucomicrobiales bacterium]